MNPNAKSFPFKRSLAIVGALLLVLLNTGPARSADVNGTAALINFYMNSGFKVPNPNNGLYWNNITSGAGGGKHALITLTDNGGASGTSITLTNTANAATPWSLSISNLNADVHGDTGQGSDSTGYAATLTNIWPLPALEDGFKISYGPPNISVNLSGLTAGDTYTVLLYGDDTTQRDHAMQTNTLTVGASASPAAVVADSGTNLSTYAEWTNITPVGGNIIITIALPSGDNWGALNCMVVSNTTASSAGR
jgi:hypothetical protein